jgi:hypothetical protein
VLEAIRLGTPVLFDGIQPAAELMVGKGAQRIDAGGVDVDVERLAQALATYSHPGALAELQSQVDSNAVPTWRAFATSVATSTVD